MTYRMRLSTLAHILNVTISADVNILGFSIDTRTLKPGDLYIALRGHRLDGHDFIEEAIARGASAVICEHANNRVQAPQLVVPCSLEALGHAACWYRQTISCPIIALTGSNGKTSVKEMIASILPKPAYATVGNLNNHIGVPLSLLGLEPDHRYAVFELGANHIGDIAHTVAMVKPDIALINNIGPAHIEGFGSIEGVARAKGEIYAGLTEQGTAIVNQDDVYAHYWDDIIANKKVLRFALHQPVDVYAMDIRMNAQGCASFILILPTGQVEISLRVPGEHSIRNALAAAACCHAAGISHEAIAEGLSAFQGVRGRMTFLRGKQAAQIIDDTYNANLKSVLTGIEVLAQRSGQRILVLGDMGELGEHTQAHHEQVGQSARAKGIDRVMTCGQHSRHASRVFGAAGKHYEDQITLIHDLLPYLNADTTILVKGSRAAAMEKIVQHLVE